MAVINLTNQPFLQSNAQLMLLPVSADGNTSDPVLVRCKTLFSDNYVAYRRACIEGTLKAGQCLLMRRQLERSGLTASINGHQPLYVANFAITDNIYHPIRKRWLVNALSDLQPQLYRLIRYDGLRRIAMLVRPLIYAQYDKDPDGAEADLRVPVLDWHNDIYPTIVDKLQDLPKVRIDMHLPSSMSLISHQA